MRISSTGSHIRREQWRVSAVSHVDVELISLVNQQLVMTDESVQSFSSEILNVRWLQLLFSSLFFDMCDSNLDVFGLWPVNLNKTSSLNALFQLL